MDHMDLASVAKAADDFIAKERSLHGLINNAGIMATPYEITKDGWEGQWQTNYLAHWLFTERLLPLMLKTSIGLPAGNVRIVNLSSSGHWSAPSGGIDFSDTSLKNGSGMNRYGQSKLANILHARTLHKLYGPGSASAKTGKGEIWTSIVHPGLVKSGIGKSEEFPVMMRTAAHILGMFGIWWDNDRGSWTSLYCAASQDMTADQCGTYFQRIAERGWDTKSAKDPELADKLQQWTDKEMVKWIS